MQMKELTDVQFDTFVTTSSIDSIYQTSSYKNVMNQNGNETLLLGLFDSNNTILGVCMVFVEIKHGFKYAYAPRGPIIDFSNKKLVSDFTNHLKKYLKRKNIVAIKINPMIIKNTYNISGDILYHNEEFDSIKQQLHQLGYYHLGYNNYFEALKPRFEAILPLTKNSISLFENIKKRFRTKIRNAAKHGIIIHKGTIDNIKDLYIHTKRKYPRSQSFLTNVYQTFKDKNQADIYYAKIDTKAYLENLQNEYTKQERICEKLDDSVLTSSYQNFKTVTKKITADNTLNEYKNRIKYATQLLQKYPDGIILATALILTTNNKVTIFIDGYDKQLGILNAKHLLLWKVVERYAKLGYHSFNLGGITNIFDNNKKYEGLNQFKLSFNPEIIEYIGDLELICNQPLYFMYHNTLSLQIKKSK